MCFLFTVFFLCFRPLTSSVISSFPSTICETIYFSFNSEIPTHSFLMKFKANCYSFQWFHLVLFHSSHSCFHYFLLHLFGDLKSTSRVFSKLLHLLCLLNNLFFNFLYFLWITPSLSLRCFVILGLKSPVGFSDEHPEQVYFLTWREG